MNPVTYNGTVDRIEGNLAVIKLNNDKEVFWPISEEITVGTRLEITLSLKSNEQSEKTEMAKAMLNDILNVKKEESEK
jgi:hypothetical protein